MNGGKRGRRRKERAALGEQKRDIPTKIFVRLKKPFRRDQEREISDADKMIQKEVGAKLNYSSNERSRAEEYSKCMKRAARRRLGKGGGEKTRKTTRKEEKSIFWRNFENVLFKHRRKW